MLSVTDPGRRSLLASTERKPYARIPEVLPIPNLIELQLELVQLVHRQRAARAARRDQPHPGLHRSRDGAALPRVRVRGAQVQRARVPHPRPDLLQAAVRLGRAAHQGDGRDPAPARLHGRLPVHDRQRHVHHQRRRARRRQPARPLAGRLLHRDEDPATGRNLFNAKVIPNRGAWLEFETAARGPSVRQGRPQAQDPGDQAAARRRLRDATTR